MVNITLKQKALFVGLITATLSSAMVSAEQHDARYATAVSLGSGGLGVEFSSKTDWSIIGNDHIQWRVGVSAADVNFDSGDDVDIAGIEYEGDLEWAEIRAGVDWFPYAHGWAEKIFFSSGLMYSGGEFKANADNKKSYAVGNTTVNPGDITSFTTEIENSQVMPYLSVGWGNKITGKRGFDFQAELGLRVPTRDSDVSVSAVDPGSVLSASDLAAEKREIENEFDKDVQGFGMIAVSYHF